MRVIESHRCPFDIALEVADDVTRELGEKHKSGQRALGATQVTRTCLKNVAEKILCNGAITDQNGQLRCPLQDATMLARGTALTNWPEPQWQVKFEEVAIEDGGVTNNRDESRPGTYL